MSSPFHALKGSRSWRRLLVGATLTWRGNTTQMGCCTKAGGVVTYSEVQESRKAAADCAQETQPLDFTVGNVRLKIGWERSLPLLLSSRAADNYPAAGVTILGMQAHACALHERVVPSRINTHMMNSADTTSTTCSSRVSIRQQTHQHTKESGSAKG